MPQPPMPPSLAHLRGLIGRGVRRHGEYCEIVEVLEDGPALVLQGRADDRVIQADQFGDPSRRVPQTYTVPVMLPDGSAYHPDFVELEGLPESAAD